MNPPGHPTYAVSELGPTDIFRNAVHRDLVVLYTACYAAPPWSEGPAEVAAYRDRIRAWARKDGFTGLLARASDGRLVGATYGWDGPPEVGGVAVPGIETDRVFHVGDLMVHPDAQRRGLGRHLVDRLVTDHRPAALVTHPDSPSRLLYEAAGWQAAGTFARSDTETLITYVRS